MSVEGKVWGIFHRRPVRVEKRVAGLGLADARDQQMIARVRKIFVDDPIGGQDVMTRAEALKEADSVKKVNQV